MWFIDLYEKTNFVVTLIIAEVIICWRFPKRRHFWPIFVLTITITIASSFIPFDTLKNGDWSVYLITLKHIFIFLVSACIIALCFRTNIWHLIFIVTIAVSAQHIFTHFDLLVFKLIGINSKWLEISLYAVFCALIYLLLYVAVRLKIPKNTVPVIKGRLQIVIVFLVLLIVMFLTVDGVGGAFRYSDNSLLTVVCLFSVFSCFFGMVVEMQMLSLKASEQEIELINRMLKQQAAQYEISKESVNLINIKCHDLRHNLADRFADKEDVRQIVNSVNIYDSAFKTGNEALDIILTEKNFICMSEGIRLTCVADGKVFEGFKPSDVYALFGNALDNAIEAVRGLDEDRRIVKITQKIRSGVCCIYVENYFNGTLQFKDELPETQNDKNFHGFGMKSMRYILSRYGGSLAATAKGGVFTLKMLIIVGGG